MSASSNNMGRAYEYAWINALYEKLSAIRKISIVNNSSLVANKRAWDAVNNDLQELFIVSVNSAIDTILELEPIMSENDGNELFLEFQKDNAGIKGDVRDIIIKHNNIKWEIGLSIKHNHNAIKHSRLSHKLDFANEWFNMPCSNQYWADVKHIFDKLKIDKRNNKKWSEYVDKETVIYKPLLTAFMDEIKRVYKVNASIPQKMVEYLIGTNDYYKIVSYDKKYVTFIYTFNMHNTLNKASNTKISAISVPIVFKSGSNNIVEMYLNNGWQLSFRIHNASTKVEPSLKFDIQFVGMPASILNIECKWR